MLFEKAPAVVFILGMAFFVLVMTNFIMNVAAIAISLPVALVFAPYLGVGPQVILLIGAAPNAIVCNSKQFTPGEFLRYGLMASVMLMVVLWGLHRLHLADDGHAGVSSGQIRRIENNPLPC